MRLYVYTHTHTHTHTHTNTNTHTTHTIQKKQMWKAKAAAVRKGEVWDPSKFVPEIAPAIPSDLGTQEEGDTGTETVTQGGADAVRADDTPPGVTSGDLISSSRRSKAVILLVI